MDSDRRKFRCVIAWMAIGTLFLFVGAVGVVYSGSILKAGRSLWAAVFPLVLGCIFAFLMNLIMVRLEKIYFPTSKNPLVTMTRSPVCMIGSFLIIILIIAAVLGLIIPELRNSFSILKHGFIAVIDGIYLWLQDNAAFVAGFSDSNGIHDLEETLANLTANVTSGDLQISESLGSFFSVVTGTIHAIFAFVIAIIFSFYVLLDKKRVLHASNTICDVLFSEKVAKTLHHVAKVINESFSRFIIGQCIEAVILGTLCCIGMLIFKFPYAMSIGVCVGATALIPVFGAWFGGIVGFVMILTVDAMQAVWFIVFLVILQQIETHFIYPNVVGTFVDVPAIWVFVGVMVGGALFGVLGMFLGVPTIATIRTLIIQYIGYLRQQKGLSPVSFDAKPNEFELAESEE